MRLSARLLRGRALHDALPTDGYRREARWTITLAALVLVAAETVATGGAAVSKRASLQRGVPRGHGDERRAGTRVCVRSCL